MYLFELTTSFYNIEDFYFASFWIRPLIQRENPIANIVWSSCIIISNDEEITAYNPDIEATFIFVNILWKFVNLQ